MEQHGQYRIEADRELVWQALNDPEVLGSCIPGCISMERTSDTDFTAKIKAKIGPVRATFDAALTLSDIVMGESYTISGGVKGGVAGFGKGDAKVSLSTVEEATLLTYQVNASVGGKLAQVGSRLVDGAARKMADDFFGAFRDHLATSKNTADQVGDGGQAQPTTANAPEYEDDGNKMIWGIAFVVLALAMILAI